LKVTTTSYKLAIHYTVNLYTINLAIAYRLMLNVVYCQLSKVYD